MSKKKPAKREPQEILPFASHAARTIPAWMLEQQAAINHNRPYAAQCVALAHLKRVYLFIATWNTPDFEEWGKLLDKDAAAHLNLSSEEATQTASGFREDMQTLRAWLECGRLGCFVEDCKEALLNSGFDSPACWLRPMFLSTPTLTTAISEQLREEVGAITDLMRPWVDKLSALAEGSEPQPGTPGRRGYPLQALIYARKLRDDNRGMKAEQLRRECLKKFHEDDLPPDGDSFRRWLNRKRANRAH